jgi:hypothetical protein
VRLRPGNESRKVRILHLFLFAFLNHQRSNVMKA